jgi:hypothetical protein
VDAGNDVLPRPLRNEGKGPQYDDNAAFGDQKDHVRKGRGFGAMCSR